MKKRPPRLGRFRWFFINLAFSSQLFAAEQVAPHQHAWPWLHESNAFPFWWIFPLMFFVLMCVMFFFMMRRSGMWWMCNDRMMGGLDIRDTVKRHEAEKPESAMDILDKRYARGEIDTQEYEEKKAALKGSERG